MKNQNISSSPKFIELQEEGKATITISLLEQNRLNYITSIYLGVASLIGWSAILNSFDFFVTHYPKESFRDVTFFFPIPLKFATFFWGLIMDYISKKVSLFNRIGACLIIQAFLMMAMPIIALIAPT